MRIIYDALGDKLTGALEYCDGCERSKSKLHAVIKKTYTQAKNPGERVLFDTTGSLPQVLIGGRYWIGKIYYNSCYSWRLFTKKK